MIRYFGTHLLDIVVQELVYMHARSTETFSHPARREWSFGFGILLITSPPKKFSLGYMSSCLYCSYGIEYANNRVVFPSNNSERFIRPYTRASLSYRATVSHKISLPFPLLICSDVYLSSSNDPQCFHDSRCLPIHERSHTILWRRGLLDFTLDFRFVPLLLCTLHILFRVRLLSWWLIHRA